MAGTLTKIAFTAKRYWGYPERWIEFWRPQLTVTPQAIVQHETYAATLDGQPIAFYALSYQEKQASLEHFWVHPDSMGKGIGRSLFQHALDRCKEAGAGRLEIESDPHAQGFYKRMGAYKVGELRADMDGVTRTLPVLEIVFR
jgi:GNAT superfamily N-acetyltransferase